MLEIRDLSFAYRRDPVLRGVSFVVSPGEVVSVVGGNGAGKTTLLKLLSTVIEPDGGQILSEGVNVFERPLKYRHQLGYLPENPSLYGDMKVRDYLVYRANLKGEPSKRVRRRVSEALEMCRLDAFAKVRIARLSNGIKRRVGLADALLLRPRVLLLDDFLAGLDVAMRELAGEILSEAAAFSSVIITGHEIDDLARVSTRFLVLKDGIISSTIEATGVQSTDLAARVRSVLKGGAQ